MDEFLEKIWGINKLYIDQNLFFTASSEVASLILASNEKNFAKFITLESYANIFSSFDLGLQIYSVQALQVGFINAIKKHKISKFSTILNLEALKESGVISLDEFKYLFDFINSLQNDEASGGNLALNPAPAFHQKIDILNENASELLLLDSTLNEEVKTALNSANSSEFIISVTGVINAGKSSMLNAFLNQKILGTSNIPETANLTLLKFSKNPYAKVKFYNQKEMEILGFSEEFSKKFGAEFSEKEIAYDELLHYTSAKNEISKYVKMITLGIDNRILHDNILVVDTPGLDDSVVLREELTRGFMNRSDAIIHLMNAAQSSTKKDMSFIIDTLKNSKNSSLIVVLTHADMLSKSDLLESLKYTKKSIIEELESYEFSSDLIASVNYFCIDSLSGSGIDELKDYLYESFFGENSKKANLILKNYAKDLAILSGEIVKNFELELLNLVGDRSEILAQNEKINADLADLRANLSELNSKLLGIKDRFNYEADFSLLKSAGLSLKDRIILDIKYAKSNKQKPDLNRIKIIAKSGINDALIDIFRAFSWRISKDIESSKAILGGKFCDILDIKFDTQKFMNESFLELEFGEFDTNLTAIIAKNSNDLTTLSSNLDELFNSFFNALNLKEKFANITKTCTDEFLNSTKEIFKKEEKMLTEQEKFLKNSLENSDKNGANLAVEVENLREKIAKAKAIKQRIEGCC